MNQQTEKVTAESRRIFETTLQQAKGLINAGVDPLSIISGLLAVVSEIGIDAVGVAETTCTLRLTAAALEEPTATTH